MNPTPTRRQFLVQGIGVTATIPVLAGVPGLRFGEPREDARVLVVLQLTGGNDGLNTVVPRRQDRYFRLRPTLAIGPGSVHALDDEHGLHPSMGALAELFEQRKLAIVQGVGHGLAERSHFRSMEIWHTARKTQPHGESGWLGRLADQIGSLAPGSMPALHVGSGNLPLALRGRDRLPPTVRDPKGFQLSPDERDFAASRARLLDAGAASGDLEYLRRAAESTYEAAERMSRLAGAPSPVRYPDTELAKRLRLVAGLIAGRFGTRIFQVELDGFDLHARAAPAHAALLSQLSEALGAFQSDLAHSGHEHRVLTLVFSEFGRRAAENGSRGTDHGAGAPVFVLGPGARGGLHGTAPDLERLVDGDVAVTTDFRAVYASLEQDWMGLRPSTEVAPLPLLA